MSLADQQEIQRKIITYLRNKPTIWDAETGSCADVELHETHGATVLLGKTRALKIKKAVKFDHMDFSTMEKRKAFAEKEIRLNKRASDALYIGLRPFYMDDAGNITLSETGNLVDNAIEMIRFDSNDRLDEVLAADRLSDELLDELADHIVAFHFEAEVISDHNQVPDFASVIDMNFQQMDAMCPAIFTLQATQTFRNRIHQAWSELKPLHDARIEDGWIRVGHGDLHLQNICLYEGKPTLFDAVEFENDFLIGDILYDFSFLLMDLISRGHQDFANRVFNRYLMKYGYLTNLNWLNALKLLPFYLSMRSGIRCHVAGSKALQNSTDPELFQNFKFEAQKLLETSFAYLETKAPQVVLVGGYSGSGKSTLAGKLAPYIGNAPGAVRVRSDEIRRLLIDWDDFSPMPQTAYTPEVSEKVYDQMQALILESCKAGHSVIVDAVFDREVDRDRFEATAIDAGIPVMGIWLDVDVAKMEERIKGRTRDASDATVGILHQQLKRNPKVSTSWKRINGDDLADNVFATALKLFD